MLCLPSAVTSYTHAAAARRLVVFTLHKTKDYFVCTLSRRLSTSSAAAPARASLAGLSARTLRVSVIHDNGTRMVQDVTIPQLRDTTGLLVSELLVVESASVSVTPRIIPRERCIIVTMAHIRGLLFRDKVRDCFPWQ